MKNLIKKNPVVTYFTLAFGWTWIIVLILILTGQSNLNNPTPLFIIGGILSGISPTVAAFIITGITQGKTGVIALARRYSKKQTIGMLLLALLTVPVLTAVTTVISNFTVRQYQFNVVVPLLIMGLVWPLFSCHGEEFGWRGFILPKLLSRFGVLKSAIILGIIWSAWHLPMYYIAYKDFGTYMIPAFLTIGFINLTLQSVIMTFIFVKSKGSVGLSVIYHYTLTSSSIIVGAIFKTVSTPQLTVYESLIFVTIFAVFAAVLYISNRTRNDSLKVEEQI